MPLLNDIHSIIVPASQANFSAHSYTEIYSGNGDWTYINGSGPIFLGGGSSVKVKLGSYSAATSNTLSFMGENVNNRTDGPIFL